MAQQKIHSHDLLAMLAVLAPEPVPTDLLVSGADLLPDSTAELLADPDRAPLRELEEANLLVLGGRGLMLPDGIRSELLEDLDSEAQRRSCALMLALLERAFPDEAEDHAAWGECELLFPHLKTLTDRSTALGVKAESIPRLLDRAARYLHSRGQFEAALELSTKAQAHLDAIEDAALRGVLHRTRGSLLADHGELDEARSEIERAIELHRGLGPQDVEVRWDRIKLAEALAEMGEHEEALRQVDSALADRDPDQADRCDCAAWRIRAWTLWDDGRHEEARNTYEHALALTEKVQGPEHEDTVDALTGIGGVLGFLGQQEESPELLEQARTDLVRALDTLSGSVDDQHPEIAVIRSNLGDVLHSLGELEGARAQLEEALDAGEEFLPRDHRGLWIRHRKLASVLQSLGHLEEARSHAEEALAISQRVVDPGDPRLEQDLQALAEVLRAIPDLPAARDAYVSARSIAARNKGENHLDLARYDLWLGQVFRQLGDARSSQRHLARALDAFGRSPEGDLRQRAEARLELAQLLAESGERLAAVSASLGHSEQGESLRQEVAEIFRETLETELEDADLSKMTAVAEAAISAAPDFARSVLEKAGEALEREGEQAPTGRKKVGIGWQRLGRALRLEKQGAEAAKAFEAALPLLDTPQAQGVLLHDIAGVHSEEGRIEEALRYYSEAAERKREAGDKGKHRDLVITLQALGRKLAHADADPKTILAVYEEQLETLRSLPEPDYRLEGIALSDMGDIHRRQGDDEEAVGFYRASLDRKRKASGSVTSTEIGYTFIWLGRTLASRRQYEEAVACYREWLELLRGLTDRDPQAEGVVLHDLAGVRREQDQVDEAIELLREAAKCKREADNPRDLAFTLHALARTLASVDEFDDALALLEEQLEILVSLDPRDPEFEGITIHDIAALHEAREEPDEAIDLYRKAAERKREAEKVNLESLLVTQQALGRALEREKQLEAALAAYEEQLEQLTALPKPNPQLEGVALHDIADVRRAESDLPAAIELYRRAIERKQAAEDDNPASLSSTYHALGRALEEEHEYPEALTAYRQSLELLRQLSERDLRSEAVTLRDIGDVRRAEEEIEEAAALFREASELAKEIGYGTAARAALQLLGQVEEERERFAEAADAYAGAAELAADEEEDPRDRASLLISQGMAELSAGSDERRERAAEVLRVAVDELRREPEKDDRLLYSGLGTLGLAVVEADPGEAVEIFREARDLLDGFAAADPLERVAIRSLLASSQKKAGDSEEAAKEHADAIGVFEESVADSLPPPDVLATFHTFCLEKEDFELAAAVRQRVVSAVEETPASFAEYGQTIARMFGGLGRVMELKKKDYEAALEGYNRELETLRRLPDPDLEAEGVALHDIGDVRYAQGELYDEAGELYEQAGEFYEQALERKRAAAGEEGPSLNLATTVVALASVRFKQGRHAEAARGGSEALELIAGEDPSSSLHASILALAGRAAEEEGELDRALQLFEQAVDLMGDPPEIFRIDPAWVKDRLAEVGAKVGRRPVP